MGFKLGKNIIETNEDFIIANYSDYQNFLDETKEYFTNYFNKILSSTLSNNINEKITIVFDPYDPGDLNDFFQKYGFEKYVWGYNETYNIPKNWFNFLDENKFDVAYKVIFIRKQILQNVIKNFPYHINYEEHKCYMVYENKLLNHNDIKITIFPNNDKYKQMENEIKRANEKYNKYKNKSFIYKTFIPFHNKILTGFYHFPNEIKMRAVKECPRCNNCSMYHYEHGYRNGYCDNCGYWWQA